VPDERVIGRYAIGDRIASGGMATVHVGRVTGSLGFTRTVAIKRLHERYVSDPKFVSMFVDEARLAARVRHPNVVPTLDVVVDTGEVFVVLEYAHGEALNRLTRLVQGGQVPLRIACGIAFGVLLGLHAAHDARNERGEPLHIVHRDVSPQNVLVGPDGVPRLVDFGIAKALGRLRTTENKEVKGKIAYLSPEQLRGGAIDQRTDVWAASAVLWEMLAGMRLFRGDETPAVLYSIINGEIEPPSRYSAECTPKLDAILLRGLARNPGDRWPTARAMALALEECVPPATAPHIGAWAERVAWETFARRAKLIADLEAESRSVSLDEVMREIQSSEEHTERDIKMPE
jgi:serine/threonine protein kinase